MRNKKIRKIIIIALIIIFLVGSEIFLGACRNDAKSIEKHNNSGYSDFVENPDRYILTDALIIDEFSTDQKEISFFKSTAMWKVKMLLSDGKTAYGVILRDYKNEKIGDTIRIAYHKNGTNALSDHENTTQIRYIENTPVYKSILILSVVVGAVLIGSLLYLFWYILRFMREE